MTIFKWKTEFPKQFGLEKQTNIKKMGTFVCVMVLKLSKATILRLLIAVYAYASESSRFTLLVNGIGYYAKTYSLEDISVRRW